MNIVPPRNFPSAVSTDNDHQNLSNAVKSLPDTFRQQQGGALPLSTQLNDRHPLESHLQRWEDTQYRRQLEQYRQVFGIAEPMKRVMELELVKSTDFNPLSDITQNSSIHRDILMNKDNSIDWEDVYPDTHVRTMASGMMVANDIHSKIESKLNL